MPSNSNKNSSRTAKILPHFSIYSGNKPLLDLLEIQRKSFFGLLERGIVDELAKTGIFRETAKNSAFTRELELVLNPETYKLVSPNCTSKEAILKGKTYACKLYVQATLTIRSSPRGLVRETGSNSLQSITPNEQELIPERGKTNMKNSFWSFPFRGPSKDTTLAFPLSLTEGQRLGLPMEFFLSQQDRKNSLIFYKRLKEKSEKLFLLQGNRYTRTRRGKKHTLENNLDKSFPRNGKNLSKVFVNSSALLIPQQSFKGKGKVNKSIDYIDSPLKALLTESIGKVNSASGSSTLDKFQGSYTQWVSHKNFLKRKAIPLTVTSYAKMNAFPQGGPGTIHKVNTKSLTSSFRPKGSNDSFAFLTLPLLGDQGYGHNFIKPIITNNNNIKALATKSFPFRGPQTIVPFLSTPSIMPYSNKAIAPSFCNERVATRNYWRSITLSECFPFGTAEHIHSNDLNLPLNNSSWNKVARVKQNVFGSAEGFVKETTTEFVFKPATFIKINREQSQGPSHWLSPKGDYQWESNPIVNKVGSGEPQMPKAKQHKSTDKLIIPTKIGEVEDRHKGELSLVYHYAVPTFVETPVAWNHVSRLGSTWPEEPRYLQTAQPVSNTLWVNYKPPSTLLSFPRGNASSRGDHLVHEFGPLNGTVDSAAQALKGTVNSAIKKTVNTFPKGTVDSAAQALKGTVNTTVNNAIKDLRSSVNRKDVVDSAMRVNAYHKPLINEVDTEELISERGKAQMKNSSWSLESRDSQEDVQTLRPWIFLGELPLMTKRGHFILNGSPRVIVNQIARCPGIYFQEKRRGVGFEQEVRVSADLIPQRGPWLRIQSDWEGRFWARLKQEGRVKYATLYESFQEFEKQYNAPLVSLVTNSSSPFPKSDVLSFQERKTKEDRQKKALTRLFKNSTRYSLGKLGRLRINQRVHSSFLSESTAFLTPPTFVLTPSTVPRGGSLFPLGLAEQHPISQGKHLLPGTKNNNKPNELSLPLRGQKSTGFLSHQALLPDPPEGKDQSKSFFPIDSPLHGTVDKVNTKVNSAIKGTSPKGSVNNSFRNHENKILSSEKAFILAKCNRPANLLTSSPLMGKARSINRIGTAAQAFNGTVDSRVDSVNSALPNNCFNKVYLPFPWKNSIHFTYIQSVYQLLTTEKYRFDPYTLWKEELVNSVQTYSKNEQSDSIAQKVKKNKLHYSQSEYILAPRANSLGGKESAAGKLKKLETAISSHGPLVHERGKQAHSAKSIGKGVNKTIVSPLQGKEIDTGNFLPTSPTDMNYLLMAEDIDAVHTSLERLLEGQGFTDDIDHLKNRLIRTSGKLLQQQFELGLQRLNEVITPLLGNLIQGQLVSSTSANNSIPWEKDASRSPKGESSVVEKGKRSKKIGGKSSSLKKPTDSSAVPESLLAFPSYATLGLPLGEQALRGKNNSLDKSSDKASKYSGLAIPQRDNSPHNSSWSFPSEGSDKKFSSSQAISSAKSLQGTIEHITFSKKDSQVQNSRNLQGMESTGSPKSTASFRKTFPLNTNTLAQTKSSAKLTSNDTGTIDKVNKKHLAAVVSPYATFPQGGPGKQFTLAPRAPSRAWSTIQVSSQSRKGSYSQEVEIPYSNGTIHKVNTIKTFRRIHFRDSAAQKSGLGVGAGVRHYWLSFNQHDFPNQKNNYDERLLSGKNYDEIASPKAFDAPAPSTVATQALGAKLREEKRMSAIADVATFRWLRTSKPINTAFREFFGSNPLSQYMDQTNPLAEITHKRRLNSMGPGGIKRETAGMEVRGIHPTHYGRVCPIETPEGKNAGLVNSPTVYSRIGNGGFMETPLYQVVESQVQMKRWAFFSAQQEEDEESSLATCDIGLSRFNLLSYVPIPVQTANNPLAHFQQVERNRVGYRALSPVQTISVATALIPFLEHDDANRALMGSNMQRQAIPLLLPERPIVGTGFEPIAIIESGQALQATKIGCVSHVSASKIILHTIHSIGGALPQNVIRRKPCHLLPRRACSPIGTPLNGTVDSAAQTSVAWEGTVNTFPKDTVDFPLKGTVNTTDSSVTAQESIGMDQGLGTIHKVNTFDATEPFSATKPPPSLTVPVIDQRSMKGESERLGTTVFAKTHISNWTNKFDFMLAKLGLKMNLFLDSNEVKRVFMPKCAPIDLVNKPCAGSSTSGNSISKMYRRFFHTTTRYVDKQSGWWNRSTFLGHLQCPQTLRATILPQRGNKGENASLAGENLASVKPAFDDNRVQSTCPPSGENKVNTILTNFSYPVSHLSPFGGKQNEYKRFPFTSSFFRVVSLAFPERGLPMKVNSAMKGTSPYGVEMTSSLDISQKFHQIKNPGACEAEKQMQHFVGFKIGHYLASGLANEESLWQVKKPSWNKHSLEDTFEFSTISPNHLCTVPPTLRCTIHKVNTKGSSDFLENKRSKPTGFIDEVHRLKGTINPKALSLIRPYFQISKPTDLFTGQLSSEPLANSRPILLGSVEQLHNYGALKANTEAFSTTKFSNGPLTGTVDSAAQALRGAVNTFPKGTVDFPLKGTVNTTDAYDNVIDSAAQASVAWEGTVNGKFLAISSVNPKEHLVNAPINLVPEVALLAFPQRGLPIGKASSMVQEALHVSKKISHEIATRLHLCSTHSTLFLKPIEQSLQIYQRSNQETCLSQRPLVHEGDWVQRGDFVADCSASDSGDLALGKNVTVAYMPWEGYNFEDAIVISDRLVADDVYTSIHIERYEIKVSKNSQGKERITNQIPSLPHRSLQHLDNSGIARVSSWVQPGDILVGKVVELKRPLSPYERLAWELASRLSPTSPEREKWLNKVWLEDISLRLPPGVYGRVINSQVVSTEWSEKDQIAYPLEVHIYLAIKRKIQVGDKLAGRHGNKGIVSIILPRQDMPYLGDGSSVDMVLNPLGVPSRMNLGQIFECLLGLAGSQLGCNFKVTPFDEIAGGEASRSLVFLKLYQCRLIYKQQWLFTPTFPGKSKLFDGRTGEPFENWVTVGQAYMLKLIHMVDHKIHARSTGPYSLFTRQPVRGRSRRGGQRLGEMEVWAVEGFGAAYTLQEFLTIKSDDLKARSALQRGFYKQNDVTLGKIHISPGNPEAFKVLVSELQALCLHIQM